MALAIINIIAGFLVKIHKTRKSLFNIALGVVMQFTGILYIVINTFDTRYKSILFIVPYLRIVNIAMLCFGVCWILGQVLVNYITKIRD